MVLIDLHSGTYGTSYKYSGDDDGVQDVVVFSLVNASNNSLVAANQWDITFTRSTKVAHGIVEKFFSV